MTVLDQTHKQVLLKGLSTDTKPTTNVIAGSLFYETDTGNMSEFYGTSWTQTSTGGKEHAAIKTIDNHPSGFNNGNTTVIAAAGGNWTSPDLRPYGYPYKTVVFTNANATNTATLIWGVAQGMFYFQITGTSPDVDLTATNANDDVFNDVFVEAVGAINRISGQTLGAGQFVLYKK